MTVVLYALCAVTSLACMLLLAKGFRATRARLLLWSALCFAGFTIQNAMLVLDRATPSVDLSIARSVPALVGVLLLVFGLVWESR